MARDMSKPGNTHTSTAHCDSRFGSSAVELVRLQSGDGVVVHDVASTNCAAVSR